MHTVGMWEASSSLKPTMCPRQRKYNYNMDCMVAIFYKMCTLLPVSYRNPVHASASEEIPLNAASIST